MKITVIMSSYSVVLVVPTKIIVIVVVYYCHQLSEGILRGGIILYQVKVLHQVLACTYSIT